MAVDFLADEELLERFHVDDNDVFTLGGAIVTDIRGGVMAPRVLQDLVHIGAVGAGSHLTVAGGLKPIIGGERNKPEVLDGVIMVEVARQQLRPVELADGHGDAETGDSDQRHRLGEMIGHRLGVHLEPKVRPNQGFVVNVTPDITDPIAKVGQQDQHDIEPVHQIARDHHVDRAGAEPLGHLRNAQHRLNRHEISELAVVQHVDKHQNSH